MDKVSAFEAVTDSLAEGVIVVDAAGVLTLFNPSAGRITGLKREEALGRHAKDVLPGLGLHEILASGKSASDVALSFGSTNVIATFEPLTDEGSNISGAVAVLRDLTELESLMAEVKGLWQSRQLLESVIESINDAISVADSSGNMIIVNPAYSRLTGLPKEAVIGKPATVDIAEGESMHMQVLRTGNPVRNIHMKVGPLKRDVLVNVAPILLEGGIAGAVAGSVGVIHDISEIKRLTNELTAARGLLRRLRARYTWDDITGESPAILSAKEQALRAAETPATVLLRGESGNGKELFAHAIHNASERHDEQFVSVNCAAIAGSLLESELFGYVEGAFTGALKGGKRGFFEEAHGGTIFLDEIGELSLTTQSKLLRVLQEREIVPVGGTEPMTVDVRVIAATNADLEAMIKENAFREDLYYRLNVLPIFLIPLRDRKEDIPLLATQMLFRLNQDYHRLVESVSTGAMDALMKHHWPGNVRELQNVLGQAMLNMRPQDKVIEAAHIPLNMGALAASASASDESAIQTPDKVRKLKDVVAESEADAIRAALRKTSGNRTEAAKLLGVSLRSMYYKIERYNID